MPRQAWWCPAKAAGAIVRAANANGKDVIAAAAARGSSSFGTRIHPDARNKPHVARRLPTKQFTGPPTEGIVAHGRSVDLVLHDAEPEIAGYSREEKRYIMRKPMRRVYEGEVITLPAEEVARLRERGFLDDPNAAPSNGPRPAPAPPGGGHSSGN